MAGWLFIANYSYLMRLHCSAVLASIPGHLDLYTNPDYVAAAPVDDL